MTPGFPLLAWTRGYRKDWLKGDCMAGITASAVVLPKALAYAGVAGLPIEVGLYTAFVPMLIYAFFGTSRPLSVSTSATLAILAVAALGTVAPNGDPATLARATATLTLLTGGILIVASVFRLGVVANFISAPVLTGFKAGIAIVIVLDQLPKLLGIHIAKSGALRDALAIVEAIPHASLATVVIGVGTLLILLGMERFVPKAPAPLVAVAAGIACVPLLHLEARGVHVVGHVPTGLPSIVMPDTSMLGALWPAAAGIALMSFTESIAAGRAFVGPGEPLPEPNVELWATGLGNAVGAVFGSMPAGGGATQTAVNRLVGAHTQLAGLVTSLVALGCMLFLAPLISLMPYATLAAIVIVYSVGLFRPAEFAAIRGVRHVEFRWAVIALLGVIFLGTLKGILVAIVMSLLSLSYQALNPPLYVLRREAGGNVFRPVTGDDAAEADAGLLVLKPEGRLFFGNTSQLEQKIRPLIQKAAPRVVVLEMSAVFDIEYTALVALTEAQAQLRESKIELWLAGLNPTALETVQRSKLAAAIGAERIFTTLDQAFAAWQAFAAQRGAS
ncbi:STAS domain-containing protein [Dyella solisilvae]|uniref:STAS domain-containing protein n=1 Tax=Dyella solisilvae TaxID=1920168 RepID=A0A370K2S4_9GAMM|nr:SulP family inorganic anion transporter [Dyella solisilvae]RDI96966.1 STAS domain-containing protein [Dyella solisilvae]